MAFKFVILAALVAVAHAGVISNPSVLGHTVATYGAPSAYAAHGYAAPAYAAHGYAAPAYAAHGYAAPAYAAHGYAAPAYATHGYAAPTYATRGYAAPTYAHAAPLAYAAAPAYAKAVVPGIAKVAVDTDYDPHPQYSYSYDIQDALTGDSHSQHESRDGDVVQGSYSLNEPDGTRRTVDYTADSVNGFNAVVHKEGVPIIKAAVAAPVYAKVAAPLAYAAPRAYATPIGGYHSAPAYGAYGAYHSPAVASYAAPAYGKAYLG